MATYLQMCQEVHRTIRAGNNTPGSTPTAVTGQTGLEDQIVRWVKRAWMEVQQSREEWRFLTKQVTPVLASAASTIAASTVDSNYAWVMPFSSGHDQPHILMYATADGIGTEGPVWYLPYEIWRGLYDRGTRPTGKPGFFTVLPSRVLQFDTVADQEYTARLDVRLDAQELATNTDTPLDYPASGTGLLDEFHDVIVWKAVQYYCMTREGSDKLMAMAEREYRRIFDRMCSYYLPELRLL